LTAKLFLPLWHTGVQYAFPIDDLVAVYLNVPIVAVPSVPKFIKGISNLRGYITPVLDLAELFKIQQADNKQQKSYCILAQYQENICAFHVQRVDDIQSINLDTLSAVSDQAYKHDYLRGISADDVVLINTKAILEDKTLIVDELMQ
jgi:chemotaxis signal transduction protein